MGDINSEKVFNENGWKIRDHIQELENAKNKIIMHLGSDNKMWVNDAKAFYFNTISAWEMLRAASQGQIKYLQNSIDFLNIAKSALYQSMSELKTFKNTL